MTNHYHPQRIILASEAKSTSQQVKVTKNDNTSNNVTFTLPNTIHVDCFQINKFCIHHNWYTYKSSANTFKVDENGSVIVITIEPASYSDSNLATAVGNAMSASLINTYTVTLTDEGNYQIARSAGIQPWHIDFEDGDFCDKYLGMNKDLVENTNFATDPIYVGKGYSNLLTPVILLELDIGRTHSIFNSQVTNYYKSYPVNKNNASGRNMLEWGLQYNWEYYKGYGDNIQNITVKIKDIDGEIINNQSTGLGFVLDMTINPVQI